MIATFDADQQIGIAALGRGGHDDALRLHTGHIIHQQQVALEALHLHRAHAAQLIGITLEQRARAERFTLEPAARELSLEDADLYHAVLHGLHRNERLSQQKARVAIVHGDILGGHLQLTQGHRLAQQRSEFLEQSWRRVRCSAGELDPLENEGDFSGLRRWNRLEPLPLAIGRFGAGSRRRALGAQDRPRLHRSRQLLLRAGDRGAEQGDDQ
jgi:hypothetical protein